MNASAKFLVSPGNFISLGLNGILFWPKPVPSVASFGIYEVGLGASVCLTGTVSLAKADFGASIIFVDGA